MTSHLTSTYLERINVSSVIKERVSEIEFFYLKILGKEQPDSIFLSESIDAQGQKSYENVSFFFGDIWAEAHFFQVMDKFDLATIKPMRRLEITKENFDMSSAIETSKLTVLMEFETGLSGLMNATGINCIELSNVLRQHLLKKVVQIS